MKNWKLLLIGVGILFAGPQSFAEDWKGTPDLGDMSFGGVTGLGIIDGTAGYSLIGSLSGKIISNGFIPSLTDSVSLEGMFGPFFMSNMTAWLYSAHLRWDFEKDSTWTFFAIGGVGGNFKSVNSNAQFEMTPRFGVGAFWKLSSQVRLRGDIAHDLIAVGVNVPF